MGQVIADSEILDAYNAKATLIGNYFTGEHDMSYPSSITQTKVAGEDTGGFGGYEYFRKVFAIPSNFSNPMNSSVLNCLLDLTDKSGETSGENLALTVSTIKSVLAQLGIAYGAAFRAFDEIEWSGAAVIEQYTQYESFLAKAHVGGNFNPSAIKRTMPFNVDGETYYVAMDEGQIQEWNAKGYSTVEDYLNMVGVPDGMSTEDAIKAVALTDQQVIDANTGYTTGTGSASDYGTKGRGYSYGGTVGATSDIMNSYTSYKDGSGSDYTANKTWMPYTALSTSSDQGQIQAQAKTDQETGIRYVEVDGLTDSSGNTAKIYCGAFGDVVASAATGSARCGDVVKVTWDDGTYDYMVVGDTKGGYQLGHTTQTEDGDSGNIVSYSNAIELIVDRSCSSDTAVQMRNYGTWGSGTYTGTYYDGNETMQHWGQGFSNIELVGINVLD